MMADGAPAAMTGDTPAQATAARLVRWFSPGFPTGAFGFSHGREWAVEAGDVGDGDSLTAWIGALLDHGAGWSDAVLLASCQRVARAGDWAGIAEIAELAAALQPSAERR